jgi:hypothetical protein
VRACTEEGRLKREREVGDQERRRMRPPRAATRLVLQLVAEERRWAAVEGGCRRVPLARERKRSWQDGEAVVPPVAVTASAPLPGSAVMEVGEKGGERGGEDHRRSPEMACTHSTARDWASKA